MTFTIEQIIGVIGACVATVVTFVFQTFSKRLDAVEAKQTEHELHVVATYVKDTEFKQALEPLFKKLDRMEVKIDSANLKLAEKQDRPR
jgi:uncharacterized protein (DUF2267 family)